jgi:hypothetical protein
VNPIHSITEGLYITKGLPPNWQQKRCVLPSMKREVSTNTSPLTCMSTKTTSSGAVAITVKDGDITMVHQHQQSTPPLITTNDTRNFLLTPSGRKILKMNELLRDRLIDRLQLYT